MERWAKNADKEASTTSVFLITVAMSTTVHSMKMTEWAGLIGWGQAEEGRKVVEIGQYHECRHEKNKP